MEYAEATLEYLTALQDGIFDNADSVQQRIPKSSFRKEVTSTGGSLIAALHMQWLFKGTGSAPGKMRPVQPFYDFIVDRGIQPYPKENKDGSFSAVSQESLAWAMAISQAREGSAIYQGKKPGVDLESVLKKETPIFLSKLAKNIAASIATTLRNAVTILLIALLLGACGAKVPAKRDSKKIKKEHTVTVAQTFLMVGCFMLGYGLTNEYLIEK